MIRIPFVALALLGLTGATAPRQHAAEVAPFRMTVESTPTGWSGRCDSGCAWIETTVECAKACRIVVQAQGFTTLAAGAVPASDSGAFSFVLERGDGEVHAVSHRGTAWTNLGWSCSGAACRAVVDAFGVASLGSVR